MPFTHRSGASSPTKKGKRKPPPPSAHERAEHEGRVTQPGVPKGPRQTVPRTPTQKKKQRKERRQRKEQAAATRRARRLYPKGQPKATAKKPRIDPYAYKPPSALELEVERKVVEPAKKARVLPKEPLPGGGSPADRALEAAEFGSVLLPGGALVKGAKLGTKAVQALKATEKVAEVAPRAAKPVKAIAARGNARQAANLTKHEKRAAALRASRRVRPKARYRAKAKGKRYAKNKRIRYGKEGRKVARRQRSVKLGLLSPQLTATGAGVGGLGILGAGIEGHIEAIRNDPGAVAKRTIEIAPGLVISTADLAAQAVQAIGTGDATGLKKRLDEEAKFAKELASVMASGDKKRVQKYAEENGLIAPLILAPPLIKAGKIGKGAARSRRDPIEAAEQAVRDAERGKVGKARMRRAKRKQLARDAARTDTEAGLETKAAGLPIVQAYTGRRGKKGVKGRRQLKEKPVDAGDLAPLIAEEGITRTNAAENFAAVAEKWNKRPVAVTKREGGVTGHDLLNFVAENPGVWNDKAFWRTVDAYRRQEPDVVTSPAIRDVEQAKTLGVRAAEDRPTPVSRELIPGVASMEDVVTHIGKSGEGGKRVRKLRETIRAAEGKARELRAEARQLGKQDRRRGTPYAVSNRRREQLLNTEADIRGMRAELADTRKRHQRIAASLRDPAQQAAARAEFDAELAAVREDRGLTQGAYVPHVDVSKEGIPSASPIVRGAKKIHRRERGEKSLAERGLVDYSLPTIVQAGVEAPRYRKAVHRLVNRAVHEAAIPIVVDGKTRRVATRNQFERALTSEQKRRSEFFPLAQFNQAVKEGDVKAMTDLVANIGEEIEGVKSTRGLKGVVIDKDFGKELRAQISAPGNVLDKANLASRGIARTILASPAWVEAQIVAESLQAAHAINPLNPMNIYHTVQGLRGRRAMSPQKRREFDAMAGARPPGSGGVSREFMTVDGRSHKAISTQFRKMERVLPIKRLIQAVRLDWINAIDRAKGGGIRITVAAQKAHKDAMGFGKTLERAVKGQHELSKELAAMTPAQRLEWAIRDTPSKRRNENYVSDVLGNWRALSRNEKVAAPVAIFYPFLRMSLQWPFYTFPKRHPIRAAVMYEMAASHNAQLRELLGGPPSWLSNFGKALIYDNNGKGTTISASRIIPSANAVFEAVSQGGDIAAQRGFNPVVGAINALINGVDPLSGDKVDEHLSAEESFYARAGLLLSVLFNTAPPLRAVDQLLGSREKTSAPVIGPRREDSALGEVIEALSGGPKERALNTLVNPFPAQSFEEAQDSAALGRIFEIWRSSGSDAQDIVIGKIQAAKRQGDQAEAKTQKKRLAGMRARSDEADNEIKRLYQKYAESGWRAEEEKESDEYWDLKYPDEKKKGGNPYLEALDKSSSKGNAYLKALEGSKSKGNPYLEALK